MNLERQLKDADIAIKKLTSESRRLTLTKQLEEKVKESDWKSKSRKEPFYSPTRINKTEREIVQGMSQNAFGLFEIISKSMDKVVGVFKYPECLLKLSVKEGKIIKSVSQKLERYQTHDSIKFINSLARIISLRLTWEKYIEGKLTSRTLMRTLPCVLSLARFLTLYKLEIVGCCMVKTGNMSFKEHILVNYLSLSYSDSKFGYREHARKASSKRQTPVVE